MMGYNPMFDAMGKPQPTIPASTWLAMSQLKPSAPVAPAINLEALALPNAMPPSQPMVNASTAAAMTSPMAPPTAQPAATPRPYKDPGAPDMTDLKALIDQADKTSGMGIAQQKAGIEDFGRNLEATKAMPLQTDLSSLAGLVDAWTGSNMASTYKAPENSKDRIAQVTAMQNYLGKQKQGLSESELGLLKQRIGGEESIARILNDYEMKKLQKAALAQGDRAHADYKDSQRDSQEAELFTKGSYGKEMSGAVKGQKYVNTVRDIIARNGGAIPSTGEAKAEFQSALIQLQIDSKNRFELGALSGPDMGLIEGALGTDDLWKQKVAEFMSGGAAGVQKRLDVASEDSVGRYNNARKLAGKRFSTPTAKSLIDETDNQWKAVAPKAAPTELTREQKIAMLKGG